ncbi:MAG: glycosyltransferase family 39 protein [Campylobacter sp.]|nr:glycosyltransferase family 39 protein [Campylobacter sp.]
MQILREFFDRNDKFFELKILFLICFLDIAALWFCASFLSISYHEAKVFFYKSDFVSYLIHISTAFFGQNEFALRMPMVVLHVFSVILLYNVSKFYLSHSIDRLFSVSLFVLLPGVVASAVLVSDAGLCIMLALLLIYLFHLKKYILFYVILFLTAFIKGEFIVLYLAFFIYALTRKNAFLAWFCVLLFAFDIYFFGFDTKGKPSGHFVDTFGIFAAVFSPFVFAYFVYTIYRIWVKESSKELLWYVSVSAFCFSILISLRQRFAIEIFLPFCVISTPLMVKVFMNSYRIRLARFRRKYTFMAAFVLVFLLVGYIFIVFNHLAYRYLDDPKQHFAYRQNVAKELSKELKNRQIYKIYSSDNKLALRLKFYGIEKSGKFRLKYGGNDIVIKRMGKKIANFTLKKL